ncbi:hypothetical protein L1987_45502 [Smallanthus sonchifolius]|uniref:Uncharacterized protein n=1 Tax=Smallanthus sonchifolius TaxID=185202 RepID=A0ACB9FY43_9ASTR|nr:hypothetical protein L1987_45502 [Smallanthus sonchifolius]
MRGAIFDMVAVDLFISDETIRWSSMGKFHLYFTFCCKMCHIHKWWMLYDDKTVKVVRRWEDVLSMCITGHLQPQVLFYEVVNLTYT